MMVNFSPKVTLNFEHEKKRKSFCCNIQMMKMFLKYGMQERLHSKIKKELYP